MINPEENIVAQVYKWLKGNIIAFILYKGLQSKLFGKQKHSCQAMHYPKLGVMWVHNLSLFFFFVIYDPSWYPLHSSFCLFPPTFSRSFSGNITQTVFFLLFPFPLSRYDELRSREVAMASSDNRHKQWQQHVVCVDPTQEWQQHVVCESGSQSRWRHYLVFLLFTVVARQFVRCVPSEI